MGELIVLFLLFRLPVILATIALIVFGLWRGLKKYQVGRKREATLWFLVGLCPVVFFIFGQVKAILDIQIRNSYVSSIKHQPFDSYRPRTLEIHGEISRETIDALLNAGVFDRAIYFSSLDRRQIPQSDDPIKDAYEPTYDANLFEPTYSAECISISKSALSRIASGAFIGEMALSGSDKCTKQSTIRLPLMDKARDAVVYLQDETTTLHRGDTVWAGGAVEIRERRGGTDWLVEYKEHPYVTHPVISLWASKGPFDPGPPLNGPQLLLKALGYTPASS